MGKSIKHAELELPENMTIANVHPIHEQMESLISNQATEEVLLHGAAVSKTDTAGVQLLYAFVKAAKERQIAVVWDKPSEAIVAAAQTLGMHEFIGVH